MSDKPARTIVRKVILEEPLYAFGGEVYQLEFPRPRMAELVGLTVDDPFKRAMQLTSRLTGIPEEAIGRHENITDIQGMVEAVTDFLRSGRRSPPSSDAPPVS